MDLRELTLDERASLCSGQHFRHLLSGGDLAPATMGTPAELINRRYLRGIRRLLFAGRRPRRGS